MRGFATKNAIKRLFVAALCLALLAGLTPVIRQEANAAELVDLNDSSVFLKQSPNTCTLYSVLMMFRRGALINGNPGWDRFTEEACRGDWWIEGTGIKNSFSGEGMRASKVTLDDTADADARKQLFIALLEDHPEGVTIWLARGNWHAVLLTDYDSAGDTFYCADPSPSAPAGRIALTESILAWPEYAGQITGKRVNTQEDILACITAYWYIEEGIRRSTYRQVQPSPQGLSVDGVLRDVEKYNIDGSNYFKLRDIAFLLSGTNSQFSVGWDVLTGTVSIVTGEAYEPDGSELIVGADRSGTAAASAQTIVINGEARSDLSVFNIGGHNFFRLRDLGAALGFDVDYDAGTDTAIIVTSPPGNPAAEKTVFVNFMFLGDSLFSSPHRLSDLWHSHGHQVLAGGGASIRQFFGATTSPVYVGSSSLGSMSDSLKGKTFNGIVILLGTNDLSFLTVEQAVSDYQRLLEELSGAYDVPIFVLKLFPINNRYQSNYGESVAKRMEMINSFNQQIEQYLRETGIGRFIDATTDFTDEDGLLTGDGGDGLHIAPSNYERFYQAIEAALYASGAVVPPAGNSGQ